MQTKTFNINRSSVIESIKEECPKAPLFMVPIFERTQETEHLEKIQIMNELFTYSTFREIDLLLPLDFQTAYSNLSNIFEIKKNSEIFEKASNISTLISNGTLPFRIKEETEPLNEYIKRIVYFKNMNIFNLVGTIPIISDKGEILENNIFDFKENKGNFSCLNSFSNPNICKISVIFVIFIYI